MWGTYRPRDTYFSAPGHQTSLKHVFLKEDVDENRSINDPNIENDQGSELAGLDNTPSSTH